MKIYELRSEISKTRLKIFWLGRDIVSVEISFKIRKSHSFQLMFFILKKQTVWIFLKTGHRQNFNKLNGFKKKKKKKKNNDLYIIFFFYLVFYFGCYALILLIVSVK